MSISRLTKTNLIIVCILCIGFSTISALYLHEFYKDAKLHMHHEAELEMSDIYTRLTSLFIRQLTVSTSMANDGFLISFLSNEESYKDKDFEQLIKNYLNGFINIYGFDATFLSITKNRTLYSNRGFDRILTNDDASAWYNAALSHDRPYDLNIDTDKFANNEQSLFVNYKVWSHQDKLLGIIGACIHMDKILSPIRDFERSSGVRVKLIDTDGNIKICTTEIEQQKNWFSLPGNEYFREQLRWSVLKTSDVADSNPETMTYVYAKYLPDLSWFIIVEHPTDIFFKNMHHNVFKTVLILGTVLLITMLVIGNVIHKFEHEITELAERQKEKLNTMRDAMMMTLADLVENRDQNTGEHIQKTAAYVKIIMEELQREGAYNGRITNDYIHAVVRSAPLHDIGKINVPDAILNKPGKLTDEEFAIMKTHAAVGGNVIGHIHDLIPNSSFLGEAKNIATYHHEKWDGKGYPGGLSGENIPLSARVMAVADVFDALVSERPYKKGFPIEKAFSIIQEERGTHFDPQIVDAFFAVKDKIIEVERKFREK